MQLNLIEYYFVFKESIRLEKFKGTKFMLVIYPTFLNTSSLHEELDCNLEYEVYVLLMGGFYH